jgi:cytochrome c oxidase assembly protein subunit 15
VLLDHQHVDLVNTSVGRLFAMLHACLAQLFACTLIAIAVSCSRTWLRGSSPLSGAVRRAGVVCCTLLFVQLAIAAVMRHSFAGLAIPTFPLANDHGGWWPDHWDFRVGIHFAHRVMAAAITVAVAWFVFTIRRERAAPAGLRIGGWLLLALLGVQLALGAEIIWTQRSAAVTTGHVLVGAMTLASTFWLTWLAHRDRIESHSGKA